MSHPAEIEETDDYVTVQRGPHWRSASKVPNGMGRYSTRHGTGRHPWRISVDTSRTEATAEAARAWAMDPTPCRVCSAQSGRRGQP